MADPRRVLVTGGGSGIGAATAALLAERGWDVETADLLPPEGGHLLDVADEAGWLELVERLWPIDALVNCAGIRDRSPIPEMTVEQFDRMLAIHVRGGFVGVRELSRRWLAEDRAGAVVSMASVNATHAVADQVHYAAAKAAVTGLTRAAAVELAASGIRINAVAPGLIRTPMTEVRFSDPAMLEWMTNRIPMRRHGEPLDIANAVAFLLSDEAAYVTGVTLAVDGGWTAC
ncbi:SDR family NAD(P)-dependent oxidoreductase [Jatrophihabitans sp. YIM 134969]